MNPDSVDSCEWTEYDLQCHVSADALSLQSRKDWINLQVNQVIMLPILLEF